MPAPSIVRVTSVPPWVSLADPDVRSYIRRVEAADEQALEPMVRRAIDAFVRGCKADGTWPAIKASCIMAGARTLAGALTPLVGTAPTNFNFVAGDYDRKTGLVGNGSTKYLDSNRNSNADPQNNFHFSCYISTAGTQAGVGAYIGNGGPIGGSTGASLIANNTTANDFFFRVRSLSGSVVTPSTLTGFAGGARSSSASYATRVSSASLNISITSQTTLALNSFIFGRNDAGSANALSNARLSFYSIGEALDLALLDARVTALINAIGAALP